MIKVEKLPGGDDSRAYREPRVLEHAGLALGLDAAFGRLGRSTQCRRANGAA